MIRASALLSCGAVVVPAPGPACTRSGASLVQGVQLRIKLRPANHPPVKVTTPCGSSTSPADMLRYIRETESKLRAKAWARAKHQEERDKRR